jgi:hypothetical protein
MYSDSFIASLIFDNSDCMFIDSLSHSQLCAIDLGCRDTIDIPIEYLEKLVKNGYETNWQTVFKHFVQSGSLDFSDMDITDAFPDWILVN